MAVRATPIFIDGNTHPAEETRLAVGALLGTATGSFAGGVSAVDSGHGVVNSGDLAVTQNGTPNMSVNVAAGGCFIRGTQSANQGCYHLFNDASVNVAISAADATNPRRDLVIAQVRDAFYSGSSKDARITVVTGTPAASPSDPSLSSFPNALVLARVAVAANATSVGTANITDLRTYARTEWNSPWGVVGYASTTSSGTTKATGSGAVQDWPNLSAQWVAVSGRVYRTTVFGMLQSDNASGSDYAELVIANLSGTQLAASRAIVSSGVIEGRTLVYVESGISGSQTRKVRVKCFSGAGGILGYATSTYQASIVIEDLGPSAR